MNRHFTEYERAMGDEFFRCYPRSTVKQARRAARLIVRGCGLTGNRQAAACILVCRALGPKDGRTRIKTSELWARRREGA